MLTVRHLTALAACAVLLCGCTLARSEPAPERPRVEANQKADSPAKGQGASNQENGDAESALALNVPKAAEYSENQGDRYRHDAAEYWTFLGNKGRVTDWLLILFTFCLVLATIVLGIIGLWQGFQMRGAVIADIKGKRPYVSPGEVSGRVALDRETKQPRPPTAVYALFNIGKSHAVIQAYRHGFYFGDSLPATPIYTVGYAVNYARVPLRDGDQYPPANQGPALQERLVCNYLGEFTKSDHDALIEGKRFLYFYGWVVYTDNFGFVHRKRFGFIYLRNRGRYAVYGGERYNGEDSKQMRKSAPRWFTGERARPPAPEVEFDE